MLSNRDTCESSFMALIKTFHWKCDISKYVIFHPGWRVKKLLQKWGCNVGNLDDNKNYRVCNNMMKMMMKALNISQRYYKEKVTMKYNDEEVEEEEIIDDEEENKVKNVENNNLEEDDKNEVENEEEMRYKMKKRTREKMRRR